MAIKLKTSSPAITTNATDRKAQHWVARSYLRAWCDPATPDGAYLWILPKDRSSGPRWQSPKKTFRSFDMNTLTKDGQRNLNLEALYHRFETAFGNIKSKVVSGTPLSNSDHEAIVAFVAAQLIRTPKFRGRWQFRSVGDHEGQLETISDPLLRSGIKKTLADIAKNSSQLLSFSALPKAIEILGNMRMVLLKTDDHLGFITSDSPCCVVQYADKVSAVFECLGSPTANVLMSLSPNILAIFDHSPGSMRWLHSFRTIPDCMRPMPSFGTSGKRSHIALSNAEPRMVF